MASFETRVAEIRNGPLGGYTVVVRPHFLDPGIDYQKISLEPHFDNHCASIAVDHIAFSTDQAPPVHVGQIVTIRAVEPETPSF